MPGNAATSAREPLSPFPVMKSWVAGIRNRLIVMQAHSKDKASVRRFAALADSLDEQILQDVTGLSHGEIRGALRLPASEARREISRLMRQGV